MYGPENPAFYNSRRGFEITPAATEKDFAPKTIVSETMNMMGGLFAGRITPEVSRDYVEYYTIPFLRKAAEGVDVVFDRKLLFANSTTPDINEAANFTNIVFAWMHHYASSSFLPDGFSRNGVLKAPSNRRQFIARIAEMDYTLPDMLNGAYRGRNLWGNINALRTLAFFEVGKALPIKFPETSRQTMERLLDGIDLSF